MWAALGVIKYWQDCTNRFNIKTELEQGRNYERDGFK
jgi:hypothetical protein